MRRTVVHYVDSEKFDGVERALGHVAVSERIAELLVAELGVVAGRIHVVPNGVDEEQAG